MATPVAMEVLSLGTTFGNERDLVERMAIHNTFVVATLALGSRPRQRELQGCGPKESPGVKPKESPGVKPRESPGVKARGCPGVKTRRSPGVTSHIPENVRKC